MFIGILAEKEGFEPSMRYQRIHEFHSQTNIGLKGAFVVFTTFLLLKNHLAFVWLHCADYLPGVYRC